MPQPFNDDHTLPLTFYVVPGRFCNKVPCVYLVEDPPPDDKWGCCHCSLIDQPLPKDEKGRIHKDEYCLEAVKRKRYVITLTHDYGETTMEMLLTPHELATVIRLCRESWKASKDIADPTMSVYDRKQCGVMGGTHTTIGAKDLSQ